MTRSELIRRIATLEQIGPAGSLTFDDRDLPHQLQPGWGGLEMPDNESGGAEESGEAFADGYADLYDFALVGYVALDGEGVIRDVNLTAAEMLGVKRTRLLGVPFDAHVASEDLTLFREHLARLSTSDQRVATELQLIRKGTCPLPVVIQSVLVHPEKNEDFLRHTTITDITG